MNGAHHISLALAGALEQHPSTGVVHVLGEALELSPATQGLRDQHPGRVHLLPAADATLVGVAVGMAIGGARPVVELSGVDALWGAIQHLGQEAGALVGHAEFSAPVVIRVPVHDSGFDPVPLLSALPGLAIASPSTPGDAGALLRAALHHDGPVVLLEPRAVLARHGEASDDIELGVARVVRPGEHASVLTWGTGVAAATEAAQGLAAAGVEIEVIDVRSARPLDVGTIAASVHRTGRPIVAGPGPTALLAAVEHGFLRLECPPVLATPTIAGITKSVQDALAW